MPHEGLQISPTVTIAAGTSKTNPIAFAGAAQGGFIMPAQFTGTAVSFEVSADRDATNFYPFHDSTDALVSQNVTVGCAYAFPINLFPFAWVKIVSNGTEAVARSIQIAHKY